MQLQQPTQSSAPCRMLRTKTYFARYVDESGEERDWSSGESSTAVYWCLATMGTSGPDDGVAHPHACGAHRCCYAGEVT